MRLLLGFGREAYTFFHSNYFISINEFEQITERKKKKGEFTNMAEKLTKSGYHILIMFVVVLWKKT